MAGGWNAAGQLPSVFPGDPGISEGLVIGNAFQNRQQVPVLGSQCVLAFGPVEQPRAEQAVSSSLGGQGGAGVLAPRHPGSAAGLR